MRRGLILASLFAAAALAPAAQAQITNDTGIPTETQERLKNKAGSEFPWDLLGLVGLFGLLGLTREGHHEDSYHPSSLD